MTDLISREPGDEQMHMLQTMIAPQQCGPVEEDVKSQPWAATISGRILSGKFYEPVRIADQEAGMKLDRNLAEKLWKWTKQIETAAHSS